MAWTAPMTATINDTLTAAEWNTYVRDNLLETEAAKATALPAVITDPDSATEFNPGSFFVATGANAISELKITEGNASKFATDTTTSTTYTNLDDSYGPAINVITATSAIVMITAELGNSSSSASTYADFAVSGATTRAATDTTALRASGYSTGDNMQRRAVYTKVSLTAGTNTFTMQYRTSASTGKFRKRQMVVFPI